jgi:hypothetical protein
MQSAEASSNTSFGQAGGRDDPPLHRRARTTCYHATSLPAIGRKIDHLNLGIELLKT